ncbi:MAG: hypothetical protein RH949_14570 [Coleofasciculus sp. A1-SPW-01]|uniref:hypothetical protein n=1 Tax=Coleofasciculus sp. A1-SPW-01 TaxID=3070819 RepID=UPI0032F6343A
MGIAHDGGLTQLKLWDRFVDFMGARHAPLQFLDVILIHQIRCATPLRYIKGLGEPKMQIFSTIELKSVTFVLTLMATAITFL